MGICRRATPEPARNPLVPVVRPLSARGRRALYAAANAGLLRRGTWNGCALNRAGMAAGAPVRSRGEAALAFGTTPEAVRRFIEVWDLLWGTNRHCTQLLREALEHVGLFDEGEKRSAPLPAKTVKQSSAAATLVGPRPLGGHEEAGQRGHDE